MFLALFAIAICFLSTVHGGLVKTNLPPRGWNSYDSFGTPNETIGVSNAQAMKKNGLDKFNYEYVTLDAGWYGDSVNIDQWGRPVPDPVLFPSSPGGNFRPFVDKINSIGFKVGLWYMAGIPKPAYNANSPIKGTSYRVRDIAISSETYCPRWYPDWGYNIDHSHPAAQAWYNSLVELWASWGVDLIKLDCVNAQDEAPSHRRDIIALHSAFSASSQDFVFSLSPGGFANISQLRDIAPYVSMARVTDDFWDNWELYMNSGGGGGSRSGFSHWDAARDLVSVVQSEQPTFWIDLDMFPLGRIGHEGSACSDNGPGCPRYDRYTNIEKQSIVTLWSLVQSPFIIGGDQTDKNVNPLLNQFFLNTGILDFVEDIVESRESLRVNSTSTGFIVWQANSKKSPNTQYVAVFNLFNSKQNIVIPWNLIGISLNCTTNQIYDIWAGANTNCDDSNFSGALDKHAVALLKIQ